MPRPPHTAVLGVPGERTGAAANVGERGASKVGLPGVANNRYQVSGTRHQVRTYDTGLFYARLSGVALDSRGQHRGFKSPRLFFFLLFFFWWGAWVGWWVYTTWVININSSG